MCGTFPEGTNIFFLRYSYSLSVACPGFTIVKLLCKMEKICVFFCLLNMNSAHTRLMCRSSLFTYTCALSARTHRSVCCLKEITRRRKPALSRLTIEAGSRSHILRQKQDSPNVIWYLCDVISETKHLYMRLNYWNTQVHFWTVEIRKFIFMIRMWLHDHAETFCGRLSVTNGIKFLYRSSRLCDEYSRTRYLNPANTLWPLFFPKRHTPGKFGIRKCRRNSILVNVWCNRGDSTVMRPGNEERPSQWKSAITDDDCACTASFVFRENYMMRGSMICTLTKAAVDEVGRACGACEGELKCI
jgi:hypothetical protein